MDGIMVCDRRRRREGGNKWKLGKGGGREIGG